MAISNWLTRDEWNACYFVGAKEAQEGKPCSDLGQQICLGIGALHRVGYKFTGIESTADGDYEKVTQCCDGNENVLVELMGGFDGLGRAKELLAWAETAIPSIDLQWLRDGVKEAEA